MSTAKHLLPLWAFVACSRVSPTFTPKCHKILWYKHKCNFIHTTRKYGVRSTDFRETRWVINNIMCTSLIVNFSNNWATNKQTMDGNTFTSVSKVRFQQGSFSWNKQLLKKFLWDFLYLILSQLKKKKVEKWGRKIYLCLSVELQPMQHEFLWNPLLLGDIMWRSPITNFNLIGHQIWELDRRNLFLPLGATVVIFTNSFLGFCDHAPWANCEEREKTNKMQQLDIYYRYFLNMLRASLCPSSGEQDMCLLHMVCCAVTSKLKVHISCNVFFVG